MLRQGLKNESEQASSRDAASFSGRLNGHEDMDGNSRRGSSMAAGRKRGLRAGNLPNFSGQPTFLLRRIHGCGDLELGLRSDLSGLCSCSAVYWLGDPEHST